MDRHWYHRVDERDRGRTRLATITGWTAAAAVVLAAGFGVVLAQKDQAAAAPGTPPVTTGPGTGDQPRDQLRDDGTGPLLPPPQQPPADGGGRHHASSGGS